MAVDDHEALMKANLARQLEPHGISADCLSVEYRNDWQDYDVVISGGELTGDQIAAIREAVRMGGCPRFTDSRNEVQWHNNLSREGTQILKAQAADARLKYPDLPRFNRSADTLADFVQSLEAWAGAEPGSVLTAQDERTVLAQFVGPVPNLERIQKHLIVTAILAEADIDVLQMIGMDTTGAD